MFAINIPADNTAAIIVPRWLPLVTHPQKLLWFRWQCGQILAWRSICPLHQMHRDDFIRFAALAAIFMARIVNKATIVVDYLALFAQQILPD